MTTKATAQMGGLTLPGTMPTLIADLTCAANGSYTENYIRALCGRAAARLQAFDRWVPVSERLPEQGSTVLIFLISDEGTNIADIANQNDDERGFFIRGTFWEWKYATHWMPLPPPPERP